MNNHGMSNNNQDQVFHNLNRQFAGRGIARVQPGNTRQDSSPLTLDEFTNRFRSRGVYSVGSTVSVQVRPVQRTQQSNNVPRPTQNNRAQGISARPVQMANGQRSSKPINARPANDNRQRNAVPAVNYQKKNGKKAVVIKNNSVISMNTRKKSEKSELGETFSQHVNSLVVSLRQVPVAAVFVCIICAVLLMSILGTRVVMGDASDGMIGVQNEISDLASKNDKLEIALEIKNDLRVIEDIAINKLGMVKKDLVSRQYIKLNDEDVVETFEEEENNIGIATLFSALTKGN